MIDLKFPDGAVRQYPEGSTARDVATSISPSLAKKAVLAELNGEQRDMGRVLETGGDFRLIMRDDPAALYTIRHDTAHVLAEAVQTLFPGTQVTIRPGHRGRLLLRLLSRRALLDRRLRRHRKGDGPDRGS